MGYSFRLTARVILYAPSHRQDCTYHDLCYTSRGALAVVARMKHSPSQIIRGVMSCRGAADLFFIPPNAAMNGSKYVELLKEKPKLQMHVHGCTVFKQDGASCHRSKVAVEFLKKNKISVMEWPWNSPDLNPTENLLRRIRWHTR